MPLFESRDYCDICRHFKRASRHEDLDYTDDIGRLEVWACDDCAEEQRQMADGEIEPPDAADLGER